MKCVYLLVAKESVPPETTFPEEVSEVLEENTTKMTVEPSEEPGTSGGLTIYERSILQKEERERKLKALQETLEADFTYVPNRLKKEQKVRHKIGSGDSVVSSLADSPSAGGLSVFTRLYEAETVASLANHYTPPAKTDRFGFTTSGSTAASIAGQSQHSENTSKTTSPRLEALYKAGQEKLRARNLSDKEDSEQMRRRIENELLKIPGVYTFRPQTKWDLVAERRKMANEQKKREEEEAHRSMPKTIHAVSFTIHVLMCSVVICILIYSFFGRQ